MEIPSWLMCYTHWEECGLSFALPTAAGGTIGIMLLFLGRMLLDHVSKRNDDGSNAVARLHDIHSTGSSLKTGDDCVLWAVRLLDSASVLVQLRKDTIKPKLSDHIIRRELGVARRVLVWAAEKNIGTRYGSDAEHLWPDLAGYLRRHPEIGIAGDDALPEALRSFDGLEAGGEGTDGEPA